VCALVGMPIEWLWEVHGTKTRMIDKQILLPPSR